MGDHPNGSVVDRWGRAHDVVQSLHRGWEFVRDQRCRQSDHDDSGAGAAHGGLHQGDAGMTSGANGRWAARRMFRLLPSRPRHCAAGAIGGTTCVVARGVQSHRASAWHGRGRGRPRASASSIERTLAETARLRRLFLDGLAVLRSPRNARSGIEFSALQEPSTGRGAGIGRAHVAGVFHRAGGAHLSRLLHATRGARSSAPADRLRVTAVRSESPQHPTPTRAVLAPTD